MTEQMGDVYRDSKLDFLVSSRFLPLSWRRNDIYFIDVSVYTQGMKMKIKKYGAICFRFNIKAPNKISLVNSSSILDESLSAYMCI